MKCICRNMKVVGTDMHCTVFETEPKNGVVLQETYGKWKLIVLQDDLSLYHKSVDIIYCPFCGRKLDKW